MKKQFNMSKYVEQMTQLIKKGYKYEQIKICYNKFYYIFIFYYFILKFHLIIPIICKTNQKILQKINPLTNIFNTQLSLLNYQIKNHMQAQNLSKQLSWDALTVNNVFTQTHLIKNLNGVVRSGEFLAVMGPSGSGKSTFLEVLTGRFIDKKGLKCTGEKYINGVPYNMNEFSQFSAFVRQVDILFNTLTVYETIQFQADLKMYNDPSKQQKIDNTIQMLGLQQCKNLLVGGDANKKCISGGQKRRTSIALQLISNPQCLILDEPTSGLDSHNALLIVNILKNLTKHKKIIISTIHQPSSKIFHIFDKLMLLRNGEVIYYGKAMKILNYMQSLGIKINLKMNPADFFMEEISAYKQKTKNYKTPMNNNNYVTYLQNNHTKSFINPSTHTELQEVKAVYKIPFEQEFKCLIKRAGKNWIRTRINVVGKLANVILISFFESLLFYKIGLNPPVQPVVNINDNFSYLQQFASCIFMAMFSAFAINLFHMVLIFPQQKQIFFRQVSNGLYNTYTYFITRYLVELPAILFIPFLITLIIYNTLGLQVNWNSFFLFLITYIAGALAGSNLGLVLGTLFTKSSTAVSMLPTIFLPMVLFGGLISNLSNLPKYISWLQYLSPLRYGFNTIILNQLSYKKFSYYGYGGNVYELDWKHVLGLDNNYTYNLLYLFIQGLLFLIIGVLLLKFRQKKL